jgi:hypothetical protein
MILRYTCSDIDRACALSCVTNFRCCQLKEKNKKQTKKEQNEKNIQTMSESKENDLSVSLLLGAH